MYTHEPMFEFELLGVLLRVYGANVIIW